MTKSIFNKKDEQTRQNIVTSLKELEEKIKDLERTIHNNAGKNSQDGKMNNDFSKGVDLAVSIITGIITGDLTGGLASTSTLWLTEQIKLHTGYLNKDGKWETDDIVGNLIAHAILGAVVAELQGNSALSGGVGAVNGELASKAIFNTLYGGKDASELTEDEKQTISALSQLASVLAVAAGGSNFGDTSAAISNSKNAVENNALAQAAVIIWRVLRPNVLGQSVTITAADVLIGKGLNAMEVQAFLDGLSFEQQSLVRLALVEPAGNSYFEEVVLKIYDRFGGANQLVSESNSNSDSQASAGTQARSSTVGGGASLQPHDNDKNKPNDKIKEEKLNNLPDNVQNTYSKYVKNIWNGNLNGKPPVTNASRTFKNIDDQLSTVGSKANSITDREIDVNNKLADQARYAEPVIRGSDGSVYNTNNHYQTFIKLIK